ncbi:MAG TPA: AI-2E family transporter [Kofleriaceae bacterium]|nr:AI-2E family transporter [Kofleriaceae bacterium]
MPLPDPPADAPPPPVSPVTTASGALPSLTTSQTMTQPIPPSRSRSQTWWGEDGPIRRFFARWGLPLFVVLVLVLGREVLLPFVFGGLIAYILEPVVHWAADRPDGTRRMPRGLAIVACYLLFIGLVAGFLLLLVPRLSSDIARLGREAPTVYRRINEEWTPEAARWLEGRFPSLAQPPKDKEIVDDTPIVEAPLPPGTAFTARPLPGGGFSLQVAPGGVDLKPMPDGSFRLSAREARVESLSLEDKLRTFVKKALTGLQSKLNDVVRFGQSIVAGFIRGIFMFFFTLMIGAFLLIDLEKVHAFMRSLFPANVRADYDVIIAGIDRGLSGVIRGQLVICLINGALTYIGLLVFGVKYGLILAVVAGLMSLVPIFGSILSSVPIVIVALVSGSEGVDVFRGVAMVLWIIGIHFIEANLLNPKIIGTAAKIHPVLVIFSLFLGEHAYGLVGALLAVPVLSAISVIFMFLYKKTWKDAPRAGGRTTGALTKPTTSTQPMPPTTQPLTPPPSPTAPTQPL